MKQIKIRDAQRNLCRLLRSKEAFQIVNANGKAIGIVTFGKASPTLLSQPQSGLENSPKVGYDLSDVGHAEESQNSEQCMKCKKAGQEYEGELETEFEGYQLYKICANCHSKYRLKQFKKINI